VAELIPSRRQISSTFAPFGMALEPVAGSCLTLLLRHADDLLVAEPLVLANLGRPAERELAIAARERIPDTWMVFNNTAIDVLKVGEAMVDEEIAFKAGRTDEGLDHVRRAVEPDDALL
jgi:hypothetical protein